MNRKLLIAVCITAVTGVIALQLWWIGNYYQVNRERFAKEVNLAFEDAIKTEFRMRCDTVEGLMVRFLMDTTEISISSRWDEKNQRYLYTVANKKNPRDAHSFSAKYLTAPVLPGNDSMRRVIAARYAKTYREEDLDRHIIYFQTQNIGEYVGGMAERYAFDTTRLRPIYATLLAERGIHEPFLFYMRDEDSTLNRSYFPDSLARTYPVITKAFPTYRVTHGANFVRALFRFPSGYLLGRMIGIVLASVLLATVVGLALYYLLRIIRREKKLSAIKNDFISNISHELKTPIATVATAIEALDGFGALEDPDRTRRYLDISRKELERLSDMVSTILNLSLYEKEIPDIERERIVADEVIAELINAYSIPGSRDIRWSYINDSGNTTILAGRIHLVHALGNLIDNAIKYSEGPVQIDIRYYREGQYDIISVKDNGIGIARGDLPFIFDKFYRVPSGVHKIKGYGLGLSYVRQIMESQGGWCNAESHPGKGSIFRLGFTI